MAPRWAGRWKPSCHRARRAATAASRCWPCGGPAGPSTWPARWSRRGAGRLDGRLSLRAVRLDEALCLLGVWHPALRLTGEAPDGAEDAPPAKRFREFAEATSDWYWETDARHRFVYVSERLFAISGLSEDYWYSRSLLDLLARGRRRGAPATDRGAHQGSARAPGLPRVQLLDRPSERAALLQRQRPAATSRRRPLSRLPRGSAPTSPTASMPKRRWSKRWPRPTPPTVPKSNFLASVSHDLRTPLNSIVGFADVMITELFGPVRPARYGRYAGDIKESGLSLLEIIDDILDLSKVEAGEMETLDEEIEVGDLIRAALHMAVRRGQTRRRHADGRAAGDAGLLPGRSAHPAPHPLQPDLECREVHAAGAAKCGSARGPRGAVEWCIEVTDNGAGIAPEDIPRVLQPFRQAGPASARAGPRQRPWLGARAILRRPDRRHLFAGERAGQGHRRPADAAGRADWSRTSRTASRTTRPPDIRAAAQGRARQPMSPRQKPSGQSMRPTAA